MVATVHASIAADPAPEAPAPTVRTEAQRQAARRNGAKSRGPRTEEGKRGSCRNAVKHGLAGSGRLLPEPLAEAVEAKRRPYSASLVPRDELERDLVEQLAVAVVRQTEIVAALSTRAAGRVRDAIKTWDEARAAEVADLARALPTDPAGTLPRLLATCEGCDWLADAWQELAEALEAESRLRPALRRRGYALLGVARALELRGNALALDFRDRLDDLAESADSTQTDEPDPVAALHAFIADRQAELDARAAELWEHHDGPARASAPQAARVDNTPEGRLLTRYLAEAARQQARVLNALERLRKPAAPARNEPGARRAVPASRLPSIPPPPLARNEPGAVSTAGVPGPSQATRLASPAPVAQGTMPVTGRPASAPVAPAVLDRLEALLSGPARNEPGAMLPLTIAALPSLV